MQAWPESRAANEGVDSGPKLDGAVRSARDAETRARETNDGCAISGAFSPALSPEERRSVARGGRPSSRAPPVPGREPALRAATALAARHRRHAAPPGRRRG